MVLKVEAGNDISDVGDDSSDSVEGYERLRARALGGEADGWRLGLGVLQQRGVTAWLRVRRAAVPTISAAPPSWAEPRLAGGVEAELVGLLASMALAVASRG